MPINFRLYFQISKSKRIKGRRGQQLVINQEFNTTVPHLERGGDELPYWLINSDLPSTAFKEDGDQQLLRTTSSGAMRR